MRPIFLQRFFSALALVLAAHGAAAQPEVAPPAASASEPSPASPTETISRIAVPIVKPLAANPTLPSATPSGTLGVDRTARDATVPKVVVDAPQFVDYLANLRSEVFGANLFTGSFARDGASQFNPEYVIAIGDRIQVRLWGAFDFDQLLTVDPKGNIFIPHVGPVPVAGVRNQELQRLVEQSLARSFRTNVFSYASLAAAQPVRVFVGGFVSRPGLYNGTSMDSLLHYLDQAGGIDPDRGSFLDVRVKRGSEVRATVNLYDFLLSGVMPLVQLSDGDVIFVGPRQATVKVSGLAANAKRFEFSGTGRTVADLVQVARPDPSATHVRVTRNTGPQKNVEYYPLADASRVALQDGDELEFTADKKPGTITVRVEGETLSAQEYVLPYGARLGELMRQVRYSSRSDPDSLQLFRLSVKDRQKQLLDSSLHTFESAALTARSGTSDEARLRKDEADLLLQWVERAKKIVPTGQVVIAQSDVRENLLLENGDVVHVPAHDGLVLVSGEVLFPNAIAVDSRFSLDDYLKRAGGYTQNADLARVVVAHRDGSYAEATSGSWTSDVQIKEGDQILVLPKIDVKTRQIWKDLSQIIFQIAVSAKVILGI